MNKAICRKIFETFEKNNPSPKIELNYRSPFELLVAVLLSAQSTDVGVNKATPALFKRANTPEKMAALSETKLKTYIKTIGLYNHKAKNIIKTSKILVDQYKGKVPDNREALENLPGIGRKSANVILNSAFGHATIGVDTHVFRVSNRTKLATGKNVFDVEQKLNAIIPNAFKQHAHHWLVLHGRYICKAKKPDCAHCIINPLCEYEDKER
ncbi:MAG: endonuclease III [Pseudomonadota bacterium]